MDSTKYMILQVGLEGAQNNNSREEEGLKFGLGRNLLRKRGGADLARYEELKVATVDIVGSDTPKGDNSRVPVETWYLRACNNKVMKVGEDLGLLRIGMSIWWKRRITQEILKITKEELKYMERHEKVWKSPRYWKSV